MYVKLIQPKMEKRPMDTEIKIHMSPPLGLLTVASVVRRDHRVSVENENVQHIRYMDRPDIVGITVTVDTLPRAIEIAAVFRKRGIPVVAGGIHITAAEKTVPDGVFDVLCIGMAEGTWPDILRDLEAGCLKAVYRCPPMRQSDVPNVDDLTERDRYKPYGGVSVVSPAYDLLDSRQYLYCNIVHTSRGCPYRCDFCYNSAAGHVYINRPIADVLADIRTVGSRHIMFIDDNFIGNIPWTRSFLKELKPLRIKWNAAVSANIAEYPELLDEMRDSGCQSLFIGFESINEASLRSVHKIQNRTASYDRLVQEIHRRGIMINASFVFGLDSDTKETFRHTLEWIVAHRIETVTSHILTPYPGTALHDRLQAEGRLLTGDLSRYDTAHVVFEPAQMTAEDLYEGYLWLYRNVYSMNNILRRMPKAGQQVLPYLAFNLLYRKFGKATDVLCRLLTYRRIGRWGEKISRY